MRRLTTIILLLMLATGANAQRIHAFVSSGMTVNQIEGDELKGFKHFGYTGGVGALAAVSSKRGGSLQPARRTQHQRHTLLYVPHEAHSQLY